MSERTIPCGHNPLVPSECKLCLSVCRHADYRRYWNIPEEEACQTDIAPLAGWQGTATKKPWHYPLTLCLPHLNTPELVELSLAMWQAQTIKPYILLIDTGSPEKVLADLELHRTENVEIHHVRGHGYLNSSEPVCVALDLAHALCRTQYLFHTHMDVFPRRRDTLEYYLSLCNEQTPVVGTEMSPRQGTDRWKGTVSHTATMLFLPIIRKIGATWSLERFFDTEGWPEPGIVTMGWPDTESGFSVCLKEAGITPKLLGSEPNLARHANEWYDHARSYTGLKMMPTSPHWTRAQKYTQEAIHDARCRLRAWQKFPDARPCGCDQQKAKHAG